MRLYYSISDPFPAYRVDLSELFARQLVALGLEVEWFMMGRTAAQADDSAYRGQMIHVPPQWSGDHWFARVCNRLAAWSADAALIVVAAFRRDVAAVQCRDKFFVSLVAGLACALARKPFFYWCSYPYPEHHREAAASQPWLRAAVLRLKGWAEHVVLYRIVMRLALHVFVQSEQMRRDITGYGLPPTKMTAVPMGVPNRLLHWRDVENVRPVAGRVLYLGTLGAIRRLDMLVDAFAQVLQRHLDAELWMVGDGEYPHEREVLRDRAKRHGIDDRVVFTGFVPIEQAWAHAASAAVCVSPIFPSAVLSAGSPTKLIEYLALGRPVVCNDHPEQSHIIRESGAGLCVPWSADAFAAAIVRLLDDPAEAERLGAMGPRWVAQHRTYRTIARDVWDRYQQCLGEPA